MHLAEPEVALIVVVTATRPAMVDMALVQQSIREQEKYIREKKHETCNTRGNFSLLPLSIKSNEIQSVNNLCISVINLIYLFLNSNTV